MNKTTAILAVTFLLSGFAIGIIFESRAKVLTVCNNASDPVETDAFLFLSDYLSPDEIEEGVWNSSVLLSNKDFFVAKATSELQTSLWIFPASEPHYPQVRIALDKHNADLSVYDSQVRSLTFEADREVGLFNFYSFSPLIDPNADSIVDVDIDGEYDIALNLTDNRFKFGRIDGVWRKIEEIDGKTFAEIDGQLEEVYLRMGKFELAE